MPSTRPTTSGWLDTLLPTIGSAGDVHPVIELGTALRNRGHRATVATNQFFEQQVRDAGLDFVALGTVEKAEQIIADPRLWHPAPLEFRHASVGTSSFNRVFSSSRLSLPVV